MRGMLSADRPKTRGRKPRDFAIAIKTDLQGARHEGADIAINTHDLAPLVTDFERANQTSGLAHGRKPITHLSAQNKPPPGFHQTQSTGNIIRDREKPTL